jgi:hypothetical protein
MGAVVDNEYVADALGRVADLLEAQHANPYRVAAYRRAVGTIRALGEPVAARLERGGTAGLVELPAIGRSLAAQIEELVHTGRLGVLERLEGAVSPEDLFTTLPGIGEELAHRIHDRLGIETLEELEVAALDGRLEALPGFGARRVRGLRDSLAAVLSRSARRRAGARRLADAGGREPAPAHPPVETLLDLDAEYRRRAAEGTLHCIAPRRFNPRGESWLPILHGEREGWSMTALFSNTARAHQLGRTRDWVVIYFERDGHEDQCTVVTERTGPRRGQRVVRGREGESAPREAREIREQVSCPTSTTIA